jgi:hypothetical protein
MPKTPDFKQNRTIMDLISDTRKPRPMAETGWWKIGPSESYGIVFQNSWANVGGSGVPSASFTTSEDGWVRMRGKIDGGAAATVVFNLPTEARPEYLEVFPCAVEGGGTANVSIYPNGDVKVETI